jgi:hypothetical protein
MVVYFFCTFTVRRRVYLHTFNNQRILWLFMFGIVRNYGLVVEKKLGKPAGRPNIVRGHLRK